MGVVYNPVAGITGQYRLVFRQKENNIIIEDLR